MIFLSVEVFNFLILPIYKIKTCFLQLEYSALKTTVNKIVASILRFLFSFLKSPYCTGLGQLCSSTYQLFTINFLFNKNYKIDSKGNVISLYSKKIMIVIR